MRHPPRNEGPFYTVRDRRDAADAVAEERSVAQPTPAPVTPDEQQQHRKPGSPPTPGADTRASTLDA
jgi:hypothetical protein